MITRKMKTYRCVITVVNIVKLKKRTYGSLVLGKRVPSSLILSLMLNRRRLSTKSYNNNMKYN